MVTQPPQTFAFGSSPTTQRFFVCFGGLATFSIHLVTVLVQISLKPITGRLMLIADAISELILDDCAIITQTTKGRSS